MGMVSALGLAVATAVVAVGCSSVTGGQSGVLTPLPSPRLGTVRGTATTVASALGAASPASLLTPRPSRTPTIVLTPTITDTPGPPTATETPAPDASTASAAQAVDDALVAFAQAQAVGDATALLKAQRALLAAAASAAPVANGDPSPYGKELRDALNNLPGAETGGYDQMVAAHKQLTQLTGGSSDLGTPVAILPHVVAQNQQMGLADVTSNLQKAVDEYNAATNSGNQADLLKAQRDMLTALAAADSASKVGTSPDAKQLQKIVTMLNDGLHGDNQKFQEAGAALGSVSPQTGKQAAGTALGTATATQHDLQPVQNDVDNKLQSLQNVAGTADKQGAQHAQDDLKQAIQKAQDALSGDHSPEAAKMRDALGHAAEAAAGDSTKIQTARDELKAALGQ
jgi:hypothetical protein